MQALIFHEIGLCIWHKNHGNLYPEARSEGEKSLAQLYQEGLAMVCEHIYAKMTDTIIKIKTAGSIGARKTKPK